MAETTIDWSTYSDAEVEQLFGELIQEREKRQLGKRKALKEQIRTLLKEQGMRLEDMFPRAGQGRGRAVKGERRPVKYRDPADPDQTWTGVGRQPAWLKAALAAGRQLEDFAV